MTEYIQFSYDKTLDRLNAEFSGVQSPGVILTLTKVVTNEEADALEEVVDFTPLFKGKVGAVITVTPKDLEPALGDLYDTDFARMYTQAFYPYIHAKNRLAGDGNAPCRICGEDNMDYNKCPNIQSECNDCCGCEE
jgi:hypothetical protein